MRSFLRLSPFFFCLAIFPQIILAQSLKLDFPVEKYTLKNGLTVLLHEDHSVPMISYHTWYRVGSRDEQPGVTGAAHMLEHMMFKGAKKYSGKDFDKILHENGIVNNAFTNYDYTGYYENLPSSKLELIMDVEVDRMRTLSIKQEDLTSELQVVGEERRWRIDNNPPGLLRELMMSTLFQVSNYRWPVIGYMEDIQAYTSDKLRAFYDKYYVPNNAVLVIAGDFNSSDVKKMIDKYYGALEAKPLEARNYVKEPLPTKPQEKVQKWDVQNSSFLLAYPTVAAGHPDSFALDLAASFVGAGSSSRLHKKLVYQMQSATSASAYSMTNASEGAFMAIVSMKPGFGTKSAEKQVAQDLAKLRTTLVSEQELQKAKNIVMKSYVDGLATIDGKAEALALNEILFGDYKKLFTDLEKYNQVTAKDIQAVAKKYFNPKTQITTVLQPKK